MLYLKLQNSYSLRLENAIIKAAKLFSLEPSCYYPLPRGFLCGRAYIWMGIGLPVSALMSLVLPFQILLLHKLSGSASLEHSPFCSFIPQIHIGCSGTGISSPPATSVGIRASPQPSAVFPGTTEPVGKFSLYPKPSLS